MLETIIGALPGVLSTVVGLFEGSDETPDTPGPLALLVGKLLAAAIPDQEEDAIGRMLVGAGQALIQANEPQDGGS